LALGGLARFGPTTPAHFREKASTTVPFSRLAVFGQSWETGSCDRGQASGYGWAGWTQIVPSDGNSRAYLSGFQNVINGNIGLIWTEAVSSNYSVMGFSRHLIIFVRQIKTNPLLFMHSAP
jgi:hypothetical protein